LRSASSSVRSLMVHREGVASKGVCPCDASAAFVAPPAALG
jgi:hypothetical protein